MNQTDQFNPDQFNQLIHNYAKSIGNLLNDMKTFAEKIAQTEKHLIVQRNILKNLQTQMNDIENSIALELIDEKLKVDKRKLLLYKNINAHPQYQQLQKDFETTNDNIAITEIQLRKINNQLRISEYMTHIYELKMKVIDYLNKETKGV